MKKIIVALFLNLCCTLIFPLDGNAGIGSLTGIVKDKTSGAPLPFVMVSFNDSHLGVLTDVNGMFTIKDLSGIKHLRFFCPGYKLAVVDLSDNENSISVLLQPVGGDVRNRDQLISNDVADNIMKNAVLFREKYNPLNLKDYSYKIHEFIAMAPFGDTLLWSIHRASDSLDSRSVKFMNERLLYLQKSVYDKKKLSTQEIKDKLISFEEHGFKDPMFLFLISQFQTISFFYDEVTVGNKIYLNPLSSFGLAKYSFSLRDTLVDQDRRDTTFLIDFSPKKDSLFNGLKGSFSICSDGWVVMSLRIEPVDKDGFFDVVLYQLSEKREDLWFPTQFRSDLVFKNNKIGGSTLDKPLAGCNRRFLSDIHLNDKEKLNDQTLTEEVNLNNDRSKAISGSGAIEKKFGISDATAFDNGSHNLNNQLLSGKIKAGWFSLEINRFLRYNKFEGLSPGLGGHTNSEFSDLFTVGGYAGYGFKDNKMKYGSDVSLWLDPYHQSVLNLLYSYDTRESGGSRFFDESFSALSSAGYRFFYVNRMDYERKAMLSVKARLGFSTLFMGLQQRIIEKGYDINNGTKVLLPDNYNCSGFITGIRLAPGEVVENGSHQLTSLGSRYPIFWLQFSKGLTGFMKSDFNYNRYESKISFDLAIPQFGKSSFLLIGNKVDGKVPYFEYFNGRGTYGPWGLFASGSFVTMHPDEFLYDNFLALFYMHNFGKIFQKQSVLKIEPAFAINYGWGELKNKPEGYFLPATDCSKGYLEMGLQINNLINLQIYNIGLGAYYRMGAYSNPDSKDNLVFKIVINFDKP